MVHHLKRGQALRERLTLTDLSDMSASRASNPIRAVSVWTQAHHDGCKGDLGQPDLPKVQRLGSRKERTGQGEEHATCIVPSESSMLNTGSFSQDAKGGGQEEGGDPGRNPDA